jgi:hypothetical protein
MGIHQRFVCNRDLVVWLDHSVNREAWNQSSPVVYAAAHLVRIVFVDGHLRGCLDADGVPFSKTIFMVSE